MEIVQTVKCELCSYDQGREVLVSSKTLAAHAAMHEDRIRVACGWGVVIDPIRNDDSKEG